MKPSNHSWWTATYRARLVVGVLAATVLAWHLAIVVLHIPPYFIPGPAPVFREMASNPAWLVGHAYHTFLATVIGFLIATVIGIFLAIAIVSCRPVEQTVYTLLVAFNSLPKVAIAPLLIIWMGSGVESKWAMAAIIAIFPIIIDTALGLRSVDPDMIDLAKSLGGRSFSILRKIRIPNALPSIFAGLKVAISFALVGTIVGEFVSSSQGLGYVIATAQAEFNTTRIFSALVVLALTGTLLFYLVDFCERLLLPWHISRRSEEVFSP